MIANDRVEHRLELSGWPRQQHDDLLADLEIQPRRGAMRVRQHRRALRHHRLPPVDLRHRHAAASEALTDGVADGRVLVERALERGRHHRPRQVVVCRPEAARQDHQVTAAEGRSQHRVEVVCAIADDRLGSKQDANRTKAIGEKQRVGVEAGRGQQLGPDGDHPRSGAGASANEERRRGVNRGAEDQVPVDGRHDIVRHHAPPRAAIRADAPEKA